MSGMALPPVFGADMRAVRRELAGADDARVLEVLRYVDKLADRGQADALLAPLRDRLRRLRPPRPLRFNRLLCKPLDAVLQDPRAWRPATPHIPRSVIDVLVSLVRAAAPDATRAAEAIIEDSTQPETMRILQAGQQIWPAAADCLRAAPVPAHWASTALPPATFRPIALASAVCWAAALPLLRLADPGVTAAELNQGAAALLNEAEADGAVPWGALLLTLLHQFPQAEDVLHAATAMRADRAMRQIGEACLEASWQWVEQGTVGPGPADPAEAALELRQQNTLLEHIGRDPKHHRRAAGLQAALRAASTDRLATAVQERLLAPLQVQGAIQPQDDASITALEDDARGLRQFEGEIRRLTKGAHQDLGLNSAIAAINARGDIPAIDRARLLEILLGPQAHGTSQVRTQRGVG